MLSTRKLPSRRDLDLTCQHKTNFSRKMDFEFFENFFAEFSKTPIAKQKDDHMISTPGEHGQPLPVIRRKTACNRDCPDGCGIIATIEDGTITRIQGDPEHPVTQGFLCKRTSRFLKRQYSPHRQTKPLIRENGNWKSISLHDALDVAAEKLLHFRNEFGPASILNYRCGGSMGIMKQVTDYFFQSFGPTTQKSGDICAGAGDAAQELDFGKADSNDFFDLLNAKTIILWGKNVFVSHVHLIPVLKKAKANGTRLILIDPVPQRTRSLCDDYYQIEPGGDAALAFAMTRFLHESQELDPRAAEYCDHFDEFLDLVLSRSLESWASESGLEVSTIRELADCYANGPSAILVGWGMQRRRNGGAIVRAIDALATVSGNVGIAGGGVSFYFGRKDAFNVSFLKPHTWPRRIPEPILGQGIEQAQDPPIQMIWNSAANPVAMLPDSKTIARAFRDRFTVVVDTFLTDTADCASLFIPTVTMLEDDDLIGAYGHHYINEMRPVIEPPENALTDYQILSEIAQRVNLDDPYFKDDISVWKNRLLEKSKPFGVGLETLRSGPTKSPVAPTIVFENQQFATETGKANLIHQYQPPKQSSATDFPLRLMAISTDESQASQWQPEQQLGPATLTLHPKSANGFTDGENVCMVSEDGAELTVTLKLDDQQLPQLALMDKGGWLSQGRCANLITQAELTDLGEGAVYYDTPVRLKALVD